MGGGSFQTKLYHILIARDITEEKQRERVLHQADKLTAIGQLVGGVAHDFNNQITGIVGFFELLQDEFPPGSSLRSYIDGILHCADTASSLTHSLLTFARKQPQKNETTNIHTSIDNVMQILRHTIAKNIELHMVLDATIFFVQIERSFIENVFLNLGINARDAMVSGGVLTYKTADIWIDELSLENYLGLKESGSYLHIMVKDTGTGIPVAIQDKVFDPFFTSKGEERGTGLGLSTVYGTVTDASGSILLESHEGEGTTFHLYLPTMIHKTLEEPEKVVPKKVPKRVLIIDDVPIIRDTITKILEKEDFHVIAVEDGEDMHSFYKKHCRSVDLVIVDISQPITDGLLFVNELQKIDNTICVIFASGGSQQSMIDLFKGNKQVGCIQKPFRRIELLNIVRNFLKME